MIPSAPFLFRLSLYLCLFAATGAPQESTANAAESTNTHPTNEVRRFAGWLPPESTSGVMLFVDVSGKYAIVFRPPFSNAALSAAGTNDGLQAWLLTTNGAALEPLGHGVAWFKDIPGATFLFEPTAPMSALCALVIKTGDTMQILKIPSLADRPDGLSWHAQYQWDVLSTFSNEKLDALEAGDLNTSLNDRDRALIESAKNELRDLGVTLVWDRHKRKYVIKNE